MNKKIMAILIGLLTIGVVSAGIITYYGKITQNVGVEQAVILDCGSNADCTEDVVLDGTSTVTSGVYSLESNRETDVIVKLVTIVNNSDDVIESGITTRYIGTLELTTKDTTSWQPTDTKTATVVYTIVGNTFEVDVELGEGYVLVYAMDKENRFADYATVKRITEIDESLPMIGDWNANPVPDYCDDHNTFDNYEHCNGAKLWIVKESDIGVGGVLSWSNMNDYLYETDLIRFFKNGYGEIVIPAGETLDFQVETTFSNSNVGTYTITTEAQVQ